MAKGSTSRSPSQTLKSPMISSILRYAGSVDELLEGALLLEEVEAEVVAHALDERGLERLDMLLHEGDVFVEELLLQGLVGGGDQRDLARAHERKQVS